MALRRASCWRVAAKHAIEDFRDNVLPHVGPRRLAVLSADKNFHDQGTLRPLLHSIGIVPNVHHISHAEGRESTEREQDEAARLDRRQARLVRGRLPRAPPPLRSPGPHLPSHRAGGRARGRAHRS